LSTTPQSPAQRRDHYDVVVLGGGSGNTVIDERFDGRRVVIVEPGPLGGTCLNRGCIPSKMYIRPADILRAAERGPALGVRTSADGADWPVVRRRVLSRVDGQSAAGRRYREESDAVDYLAGTARFTGPRRLEITVDGSTRTVTADEVVVATGSRPVVPDVEGLHDVPHHTSDTIMRIEELPARIAVLGGGYIGCEFAHVFSSYGVEVTQIESGESLLSGQDADISSRFTEAARRQWRVRLDAEVVRAESVDGTPARLHLADGSTVDADLVLVATGRTPNSDELGLDAAGVDVDDRGLVVVDEHQRTSAEGVWSLGDVCQGMPLKHVANHEARVVQHNLLHPDDLVSSDHRFVPQTVFTHPQVAQVGLTESDAREQGLDVVVGCAEYAGTAYGWAMAVDEDDDSPEAGGMVKVVADRDSGRLVGAHLIGTEASILVQVLVQAMAFGLPAAELARGQFWPHPALSEVVEQALLDLDL
jgi:mycothione reductase